MVFCLGSSSAGQGDGGRPRPLARGRRGGAITAPRVEHRILSYGLERTPMAATGRPLCGIAGETVVLCLPGSPKAVEESLFAAIHAAMHAAELVRGDVHTAPL